MFSLYGYKVIYALWWWLKLYSSRSFWFTVYLSHVYIYHFFLPAPSVTRSSVWNVQLIISLLSSIKFGSLGCGTLPLDANSLRIAVSPWWIDFFLSLWNIYISDRIPCPEILLAILDFFWWILACVLISIFLFLVPCSNMSWAGLSLPLYSFPPQPLHRPSVDKWTSTLRLRIRTKEIRNFCFFSIKKSSYNKPDYCHDFPSKPIFLALHGEPSNCGSLFPFCFVFVCLLFSLQGSISGLCLEHIPLSSFPCENLTCYCRHAEVIALR